MITCKHRANELLMNVKHRVDENGASGHLMAITCNASAGSLAMCRGIKKDCSVAGIDFTLIETNSKSDAVSQTLLANNNRLITGIVLVEPMPAVVYNFLDGFKNVDNDDYPAVANAVIECIASQIHSYNFSGKTVMVVGRGYFGTAIYNALIKYNATVIVCHSKTGKQDIFNLSKTCDVIVTACSGVNIFDRSSFSNSDCQKEKYYIDVGFGMDENGNPCGNIVKGSFENQTPAVGGISALTRAIMINRAVRYV